MAVYTYIQDNSSVNLTMIKSALRISHSEQDAYLKLLLRAAKAQADAYCQSNFDDYSELPADVDIWIIKTVCQNWEKGSHSLTHRELEELGGDSWDFDYFAYYHDLAPYRREVGFGD